MNSRHQQGCRDALAADITDSEDELVGTESKKIVIIAADRAGGTAEAVHFERFQLRDLAGEQLRLHFLRDDELVFQALLFFLLEDELLERSGHGIERVGEAGQLVVRRYRYAVAEISAINVLGSGVKLSDRASDGAGQAGSDHQGDQFDDGKQNRHEQQNVLDALGEIPESGKQPGIEYGGASANSQ